MYAVQGMLLLGLACLLVRAAYLQIIDAEFLQNQGERRYQRTLTVPASRGQIFDRNGMVLADTLPAVAVWANGPEVSGDKAGRTALSQSLGMSDAALDEVLSSNKTFVYLKRQMDPADADRVLALGATGIHTLPETRRYYPQRAVMAQWVGLTDIDGKGQEGAELAFENILTGRPGARKVIRDRLGRVIDGDRGAPAVDGTQVVLSIDSRIQYELYKALESAMAEHDADGAAAIVLDARTGEILAAGSLPYTAPHASGSELAAVLRNRALVDTLEPGSIVKPFTIGLALDRGVVTPQTEIDTQQGQLQFQGHTITDVSRRGKLTPADILRYSSNVGMTLVSAQLANQDMWRMFDGLGFGKRPDIDFPGVASGRLRSWQRWRPIEKATMSYGYGLSVSLLQIATAFSALVNDGVVLPTTVLKRLPEEGVVGHRVMSVASARWLSDTLEYSLSFQPRAQVPGYRVAGKSGTARKLVGGRYDSQQHIGTFVGYAPASRPAFIVAAFVDNPRKNGYFGGRVAAPVFARIMSAALRLHHTPSDRPSSASAAAYSTLR